MGLIVFNALDGALTREREGLPLDDDERQLCIDHHAACMKAAADGSAEKRHHWERMRDLINGRSEAAVVALEKARGLR